MPLRAHVRRVCSLSGLLCYDETSMALGPTDRVRSRAARAASEARRASRGQQLRPAGEGSPRHGAERRRHLMRAAWHEGGVALGQRRAHLDGMQRPELLCVLVVPPRVDGHAAVPDLGALRGAGEQVASAEPSNEGTCATPWLLARPSRLGPVGRGKGTRKK